MLEFSCRHCGVILYDQLQVVLENQALVWKCSELNTLPIDILITTHLLRLSPDMFNILESRSNHTPRHTLSCQAVTSQAVTDTGVFICLEKPGNL